MDEEETQARELELFSMVVRAPLQILDLDIPDPDFHLAKQTGDGRQEDYILCVILRNFSGTQLKLSNIYFGVEMHHEEFNFDWGCMDSLRYFKLNLPINLTSEIIEVITRKLSQMSSLKKIKFD